VIGAPQTLAGWQVWHAATPAIGLRVLGAGKPHWVLDQGLALRRAEILGWDLVAAATLLPEIALGLAEAAVGGADDGDDQDEGSE